MKIKQNRKRKFIELCAQGIEPYRACIEAGYSPKYANTNSHILRGKYEDEIERLKPIAQEAIKEKFKYSVAESFAKLVEIQNLALIPNADGDYCNLSSAIKAEELKGKMFGVYENETQESGLIINYIRNYE